MRRKWVIGVDEAGRGPLAGPVSVGAVLVRADFDWNQIPGVDDSKKLSGKKREEIFRRARALRARGVLDYHVSMASASVIDRVGITRAVELGVSRALRALHAVPKTPEVLLDGLLRAPEAFTRQRTIIGGDGKEKVIGLASILAKVTRDRYMVRLAKQHPVYGFEIHKGYGTKAHRTAIYANGLSDIHRRTFCGSSVRSK